MSAAVMEAFVVMELRGKVWRSVCATCTSMMMILGEPGNQAAMGEEKVSPASRRCIAHSRRLLARKDEKTILRGSLFIEHESMNQVI